MYLPSSESSPASTGRIEASDRIEPPTQPIRAGTLSGQRWPESAVSPPSPVPGWLTVASAIVLVGVVGVLGFFRPGFFVTPVLDQASVQGGVDMILRDAYKLPDVAAVTCPADQQVLPGRSFTCVAVVDQRRSEVPVVIQDRAGRYQVGRPTS